MEGTVLSGRYRVGQQIGAGGMARVYRAQDTVLGREVAVKVLAPAFAQDQAFVSRFRREAQAAARLNHPNVVNVFDTGSDDGTHYIVMEFVEGRTLGDFLTEGGRLTPARACELAESVCEGLAAAHAQGVVHRDIKSGNIMVTRDGEVKVMDFGIAHLDTEQTVEQTAAVLGTASYLSPEQARGEPVDPRSDIYSLGCVLYEALTGRVPFPGDSPVSVAYKHVNETPAPPSKLVPDVPSALDAIVLRCLAKNPTNRYASATDLRADLQRARTGRPVQATPILSDEETVAIPRRPSGPPTAVLPPQEPPKTGRKVAIGVVATLAILALLGGGAFLLVNGLLRDDEPIPVKVPPVVGEKVGAAKRMIVAAGLTWKVEEQETLDPEKHGIVLAADPAPGDEAEKGAEVVITVGVPPEKVEVPSVVSLSEEEARKRLEERGFEVEVVYEESAAQPEGNVFDQEPLALEEAEYRSTVTLYVSSGQPPPVVPSVVCLNVNAATNKLEDEGYDVSVEGSVPPNPACPQPNKVAQQEPEDGTPLAAGSTVKIWLNGEAEPTESPSP